MWNRRLVYTLLAALLLAGLPALTQTSHRRPNPHPPSSPNIFDQVEKQQKTEREQKLAQQAAAREQRRAQRAELARELPQLIELARSLQEQLDSTDLDTTLPADLHRQGQELERLARQIHKRVRSL